MDKDRKYLYCAVDIETTGLSPFVSEMIQLAIQPLTDKMEVDETLQPLDIRIKATDPTDRDGAFAVNGLDPQEGMEKEESREAFRKWYGDLQAQGQFYKIIPLGQNYTFDLQFMRKWLGGEKEYNVFFGRNYRDSKVLANAINDLCRMRGEEEPYVYTSLSALAERFGIANEKHHDALNDARVAAEIYVKLLKGL